jgi:4-oxalomesaconate tautomerase
MSQTSIPCTLMRGGTSKGPFFRAEHLPSEAALRDAVLLAALGSPDIRQIDGVGGGDPLTSKVGIVARSKRKGVDLDFLFAQVSVDKPQVDTTPNCGNMLAAVVPFALEEALVQAQGETTTMRVLTLNTGMLADITVQTPGRSISYEGDCRIDGVPGGHAPVAINFLDTAGSVCKSLLPTGQIRDEIEGIPATCIDNGMPLVIMPAGAFGVTGYESPEELNHNLTLKERVETVRLAAGLLMGLGDVSSKVVPKMTLVASPRAGAVICTRTFIPHACHTSIGVLGAVSVATACAIPGSVAADFAVRPTGGGARQSIEHPSGEFTVELDVVMTPSGPQVRRAALLRTARCLFAGSVRVPSAVWDGH